MPLLRGSQKKTRDRDLDVAAVALPFEISIATYCSIRERDSWTWIFPGSPRREWDVIAILNAL